MENQLARQEYARLMRLTPEAYGEKMLKEYQQVEGENPMHDDGRLMTDQEAIAMYASDHAGIVSYGESIGISFEHRNRN